MSVIKSLAKALRLTGIPRLAIVGAGGKTRALFILAHELLKDHPSVVVTCSTHLAVYQAKFAHRHLILPEALNAWKLPDQPAPGVTLFTSAREAPPSKISGFSSQELNRLREWCDKHYLPLLIEADGARGLPLKAPAGHELPIPDFVDCVLVVAGLSAVGKPLAEQWVHRVNPFAGLSGLSAGQPITPEAIIKVLRHPQGGLKNIPAHARRGCILNQADTPSLQTLAGEMAKELLDVFDEVVVSALEPKAGENTTAHVNHAINNLAAFNQDHEIYSCHERAAGIILAAGGAERFGSPKQLLEWNGESLVQHAAQVALEGGLGPVLVVYGAEGEALRRSIGSLNVTCIQNPEWPSGQSSSVRVGLQHLPASVGSAVFLLADQPFVTPGLINQLVARHAASLTAVVAPQVNGQRTNPVLFDRSTFGELMQLSGDTGGRSLFARFPPEWLDWPDDRLLLDIDTPEDYERLKQMADSHGG